MFVKKVVMQVDVLACEDVRLLSRMFRDVGLIDSMSGMGLTNAGSLTDGSEAYYGKRSIYMNPGVCAGSWPHRIGKVYHVTAEGVTDHPALGMGLCGGTCVVHQVCVTLGYVV